MMIARGDTEVQSFLARVRALGFGRLADLILPPVCLRCRLPVSDHKAVCARCWSELRFIEAPLCQRLGLPFSFDIGPDAVSAEAIADPPPFDRARSAVVFNACSRDLVHALKFRDRHEIADLMARWMGHAGADLVRDADVIVPVPLHKWRLMSRRFNQSALIARHIGAEHDQPVSVRALVRKKPTRQQVGLNSAERARNVRGAFVVAQRHQRDITGKRVLLIDDVFTTGATIRASVEALLQGGAEYVDVLSFARVVGSGDDLQTVIDT